MLLPYKSLIVAGTLFMLVCCQPSNSNKSAAGKEENVTTAVPTQDFFGMFPEISLPFALPAPGTTEKNLDPASIEKIFAHSSYKPVFGTEKDVPDLADNAASAKYFAEGIFQTDGYTAVIIRKADEDSYYYLSTFDEDGNYIDGICMAFNIGNEVERIASINDDFSIQIRQNDKMAADAAPDAQNIFYEISMDGHINVLKDNSKIPV